MPTSNNPSGHKYDSLDRNLCTVLVRPVHYIVRTWVCFLPSEFSKILSQVDARNSSFNNVGGDQHNHSNADTPVSELHRLSISLLNPLRILIDLDFPIRIGGFS